MPERISRRWSLPRRLQPVAALLVVCLVLQAGCGESRYKAALQRTQDYYAHLAMLDRELTPAVAVGSVVVRVPAQLQLLEFVPPDETGREPIGADGLTSSQRMQPYYLDVSLPGVVAAWSRQVLTDVGGADEGRPAYLYLLSNEPLLQQDRDARAGNGPAPEIPASELLTEVESRLARAFAVELPEGTDGQPDSFNERYTERYPRAPMHRKYHPSKSVIEVQFQPDGFIDAFDVPYEYRLYEYAPDGSDIQTALFLVAPQGVASRERLSSRIDLMLATLKVTGASRPSPSSRF